MLTWAKTSEGISLPLIGAVKPWQFAFLVVGFPGLLVALGFLFVKEPIRQKSVVALELGQSGFSDSLGYIRRNAGAFVGLVAMICVMTIIAYSHGFLPSAFARRFAWEAREYALVHGLMLLAIGPVTVASAGALCDRWRKAGQDDAPFRLLSLGFVIMLVSSTVALLMPTPLMALVMLGLSIVGTAIVTATGIVSLLDITPPSIRGQVVALYYMTISIAGLGLGPTSVGWLSTRVFGEGSLHLAVSTVPVIYGIVPLLLIPIIRRRYLVQLQRMR